MEPLYLTENTTSMYIDKLDDGAVYYNKKTVNYVDAR